MRIVRVLLIGFLVLFALPLASHAVYWRMHGWPQSWGAADWSSSGLLPKAEDAPGARVLFLSARVGRWRGIFAEHSWIVFKTADGPWRRFDVVGWGSPVRENHRAPDGRWYGNDPSIFASVEGVAAENAIPRIEAAIASYPWREAGSYQVWPGPNSNSFIRHIAAAVPELGVVLPPVAVGRDYRPDGSWFGRTPAGDGVEVSIAGLIGAKLGLSDGFELMLLAQVAGIDFSRPALKLPGWGRIGFAR